MDQTTRKRLVIVSNRLPVAIDRGEDNQPIVEPGTGGLITALEPIIRRSRGLWIGWPGCTIDSDVLSALDDYGSSRPHRLVPVAIAEDEVRRYYRGYSNKTIWPLFHDLLGQFSFDLDSYATYKDVNERFAEVVASNLKREDTCWIHDYQLILVGQYLRQRNVQGQLNFFLHIPFPSPDLFRRLPKHQEIIQAFLEYDHIGFQTAADRRNFLSCLKWIVPQAKIITRKRQATVNYEGRKIIIGYYPISIDFDEFNEGARSPGANDAAWYLRENLKIETLALGLDRLDYTKGIRERFVAFERLFQTHPELIEKISLLQIVIPSRLNVPDYIDLKRELDFEAGRINSAIGRHGWVPIHYEFRTLTRDQLLGHYKAADIALVTPIRDGMNLVSKEYCASCVDNDGVLILSRFAGAAAQLERGAFLVNPYDYDEVADSIYAACTISEDDKKKRMASMRAEIRRRNVHRWVRWFFDEESPAMEIAPVPESTPLKQ